MPGSVRLLGSCGCRFAGQNYYSSLVQRPHDDDADAAALDDAGGGSAASVGARVNYGPLDCTRGVYYHISGAAAVTRTHAMLETRNFCCVHACQCVCVPVCTRVCVCVCVSIAYMKSVRKSALTWKLRFAWTAASRTSSEKWKMKNYRMSPHCVYVCVCVWGNFNP